MKLEIHDMPGHLIRRLHQISVSIFDETMKANGLDLTPVQFAALSAIHASPGIDQATVAGEIAYDRVTIGGVVDRLERKSLIERRIGARDRRSRQLYLTPAGIEVFRQALPLVREVQGRITDGLGRSEKREFLACLAKLAAFASEKSRAPLTDS